MEFIFLFIPSGLNPYLIFNRGAISAPCEMWSLFIWGQSSELLVPAPARDAEFFDYHSRSCFRRQYKVIRVVDGDTIVIRYSGKYENVRMLCVNTPESVHPDEKQNIPMGKVAARYVQKKLLDEYGEYVDLNLKSKNSEEIMGVFWRMCLLMEKI